MKTSHCPSAEAATDEQRALPRETVVLESKDAAEDRKITRVEPRSVSENGVEDVLDGADSA